MAFMTLNTITIVFQQKTFSTSQFCFLFVYLLPSVVSYRSNMTLIVPREGVKGNGVLKSNFFKEFVMTLLASTRYLIISFSN